MRKVILIVIMMLTAVHVMGQDYSGGTGIIGDPYQIANKADLKYLSENSGEWVKHFIQTADIVFADADFLDGGDFYNGGAGFIPIGNSSTRFTASYDGGGYTISNLYINLPSTDYVGFFGHTHAASISNLGLIDVNVTGDQRTGGLVGYSINGTNISNCYCSGTVTGGHRTGGLVGSTSSTNISNCYCSGTVTGNDSYTGVFVGQNYYESSISRSYSTGTVTSSGSYTGGFVGDNYDSTISDCYSRSTVNGSNDTGGLVGRNIGTGAMISKCYSTGSVSEGSNTGGLVGDNSGDTEDSFWDTVTSGQLSSDGGTGKTTDEMTTDAHSFPNLYTAAGWDFRGEVTNGTDDTWNIGNNKNDGYPYLDWQYPDDPPLPVTLSSFTVTLQNSIPLLQWTTQSENDNLGWNVYRSLSQNLDQAYQINSEMISGGGNSSEPRDYLFEDEYDPQPGMTYWYWLESVSFSGDSEFYNPISIYILQDSEDPDLPPVPQYYGLYQNYPNPFNPTTNISFALERSAYAELVIFNIKGRIVKTLFEGVIEANRIYSINWDGRDENNEDVASGIYYYRIKTDNIQQIRKMILTK